MAKTEKKKPVPKPCVCGRGGYRGVRTWTWCDDVLSEPGAVRCWAQDPVVRE
ncbi:MAG: hypothetical protein IJW45_08375 [Oscillospiraceae bacterium]|nr:hypothetical protein [Oscillospiraceae bacterium]